eukprot:CAMPEP_0172723852 /NCGR_PEP_ID=MMETSP1074-20121228/84658_1 /TAXON_ID=2916 /ORGANISM="Ceratium fusus, Strain PA161109" /LENGTH=35 /DNA_ID= /DNA_START= /DNA_END= /DNA_ORIENTATION=
MTCILACSRPCRTRRRATRSMDQLSRQEAQVKALV